VLAVVTAVAAAVSLPLAPAARAVPAAGAGPGAAPISAGAGAYVLTVGDARAAGSTPGRLSAGRAG
jgi:hypothetical protein